MIVSRMRRMGWIEIGTVGTVVLLVGALLTASSASAAELASAQTLPQGIPILDPGGPGAATALHATSECSEAELRKGIAKLSWAVAPSSGSEQRVVMTIFRDGFIRGAFQTSGPLASQQAFLVWEGLEPGIIHFWRVLTLQAGGWVPSEITSFEAPTCVANMVPGPTPQSQ